MLRGEITYVTLGMGTKVAHQHAANQVRNCQWPVAYSRQRAVLSLPAAPTPRLNIHPPPTRCDRLKLRGPSSEDSLKADLHLAFPALFLVPLTFSLSTSLEGEADVDSIPTALLSPLPTTPP